jgi:amino acid permease
MSLKYWKNKRSKTTYSKGTLILGVFFLVPFFLVPFFGVPSQTREFLGRLQITSDEQFLALVLFFSFSYVGIPALSPFIDTFSSFFKRKKEN